METQQRIKIWHDNFPMNPWKDLDCEPPLMYDGGRNNGSDDFSNGEIVETILAKATYNRIVRHQKKLAEILELDFQYFKDYNFSTDEKVNDIESEIRNATIEKLSELCDFFKIPNNQYTSRGYSQSDWADVLIVLTDQWFERTGANKDKPDEILESTAELFDAWAWGDVYGFTIQERKVYKRVLAADFDAGNFEDAQEEEEWEDVDSCGGFFGQNWMENGMADNIPKELHEQLKNYDYSDIEY